MRSMDGYTSKAGKKILPSEGFLFRGDIIPAPGPYPNKYPPRLRSMKYTAFILQCQPESTSGYCLIDSGLCQAYGVGEEARGPSRANATHVPPAYDRSCSKTEGAGTSDGKIGRIQQPS